MIKQFAKSTVLTVILSAGASAVHADDIALFVLAGQSNMQGWQGNAEMYPADPQGIDKNVKFYWVTPGHSSSRRKWTFLQPQGGRFPKGHFGPEVSFARLISANGSNLAIFKCSLGSTSLAVHWKTPGENGLYDQMITELRKSIQLLREQGDKISFKGFIWIQGESDAQYKTFAEEYGHRLKLLIDDFRKNIAKNPRLPVILGVDEQHLWIKKYPQVLEAHKKLATEGENIIFTSMIGLEKADSTHLTPKGLEEHGRRLFAAYIQDTDH